MNIRAMSASLALAAALAAGSAPAQQPGAVARLSGLEGNVLVSQGDAMVAGSNGQRLAVGTRVVTTAGARVTISYDVGCNVSLSENQRFTLRLGECAVLLSEVVPLGPAAGAIGGGVAAGGAVAGVSTGAMALGVAGMGALGYGAYETFRTRSVSPN